MSVDYKTLKNITDLITMLQASDRGVPLRDISKRLNLGSRQVSRIRDQAEDLFSVVIEDRPDPDGPTNSKLWIIPDKTFRLPIPLWLDDKSWIALQLILRRGGFLKTKQQRDVEERLRIALESTFLRDKKRHLTTSYAKFSGVRDYSGSEAVLASIGTCLRNNESARVTYRAFASESEKKYEIDPYTLVDHDGGLYLICAVPSHDNGLIRLAIERIISFVPTGRKFKMPASYDPEEHLGESFGITVEEPMRVVVRLFDEAAFFARDRTWGKDQKIEDEGKSIVISFTASGKFEILRWVLGYGKNAAVLEPAELRRMVMEEHSLALARYDNIAES